MVRLAYNESEDRHYVSLGMGGRHCPSRAPAAWEVGSGCAGKTEDEAASRGSQLLSVRECKRSKLLENMQAEAGLSERRAPERFVEEIG